MEVKENDIIMCTVKKIEGTTVFVDIDDNGSGSIVFSEIAAGRIRNIREYVNPGKKIVCKVLKIYPDHVELSLRRVVGKEREEIQERYKKQKTFESMLKNSVAEPQEAIKKIREKYELWEFFDLIKENISLIEKYFNKKESDILTKLVAEKKEREKIVKKTVIIKSNSESGLSDIKEILNFKDNKIAITYLGSSQFLINATGKDFKEAEHLVDKTVKEIEKRAKDKKSIFELKEQ